ncbi:group I truncated hemoglobin [Microcella humidisoli]|uniref:Group 1 truncated hemoglobin n=1 Tax=Microcella humidisoli TaxID=2963406 RepID=A0ABY5FSQ9_9MICO|nr:group 1 truncated hemoglobin [Microcella humidisoli]UTT61336.1 group 1 truncated hemoglobin [Microcella humidisoli]
MSLYDDIGGAPAIRLAVSVFYHRVTADESLAPWFDGIDIDRLMAHQRAFLTVALGGPDLFSGRSMSGAHAGLAITDDAFDAVTEHLAYALLDVGLAHAQVSDVIAGLQPLRAQVVESAAATA